MIRLKSVRHVEMQVQDLDGNQRFAEAFGLVETARAANGKVWFRGAGKDSYSYVAEAGPQTKLIAIAFNVEDRSDLEAATADLGATPIRPLEGPGGGEAVSLTDPEGNRIDLVFGVADRTPDDMRPQMVVNQLGQTTRRGGGHVLPPIGPSPLLRLGHVVLFVTDYAACDRWYREVLGLLPSDLMYAGSKDNVVAGFYRLNRGDEYVDHHAFAMFGFGKSALHHLSFEVQDIEHQFMAHRHLDRGGWEAVWGIGRHPLGSHVFDVWRDPNGIRFETFTDTDVVTADFEAGYSSVEESEMDLWSNKPADKYFA